MPLTIEKLQQAKAILNAAPQPDFIVVGPGKNGIPRAVFMTEDEMMAKWWNEINHNDIITGAYQGLMWSEFPDHAQNAARKLYESCQH